MSEVKTGRRATDNPRVLRPEGQWRQHKGDMYRCMVYLTPEDEGAFSVVAAHLPGVASQGNSEEEALANIIEAFEGAFSVYKEQGVRIPWTKTPLEPERGAVPRWVIVHA
jgi:predicted RNase H-like HicB family nuclease